MSHVTSDARAGVDVYIDTSQGVSPGKENR